MAGSPIFHNEWIEASSRKRFARVCILIDVEKPICPRTKVKVKSNMIWQSFVYEELPEICYNYGLMGRSMESCSCVLDLEPKPVYGPWIHAAKVPVSPVMTQSSEN